MSPDDETRSTPPEGEDFAALFEASLAPAVFKTGQLLKGVVVLVRHDVVLVDVGGKGEATMDRAELLDDDGELTVGVGDTVEAVVVSTSGGVTLSHKLAQGAATRRQLEDAYRAKLPVEGRVESVNKGGYEVRIGGQRAFCPISQIDSGYTADPETHVGQVYTFRILEFKEERKDIVVSRRALLEEEEREQEAEVRKTIVVGADLSGRIASVQPYGAFVDLGGGVQGLLHVSEMAWSRVSDPTTLLQPGDAVTVRVLGVDAEKDRISLGMKQLQADPWEAASQAYAPGQRLTGKVTRVVEFGAFIELQPGVEALAHLSTFPSSGRRDAWKDAVKTGETVAVEILGVAPDKRRIGVSVVTDDVVELEALDEAIQDTTGQSETQDGGFGSMADQLRAALRPEEQDDG